MPNRVLLLMPTTSYKAHDFLEAAARLSVDVVVCGDREQALAKSAPGRTFSVDFSKPKRALARILAFADACHLDAVIGTDDETVLLAAMAAEALGLRHNPVEATRAARDKHETRRRLAAAGLRTPPFRLVPIDASPTDAAEEIEYPCVLKPLFLSGSRGVLRADDPVSFLAAFERVAAILRHPTVAKRGGPAARHVLVEGYIPGGEVAVEGILMDGMLRVLALFDKPDALEGPTFEETIYVTPSRLPQDAQAAIVAETAAACRTLGLGEGPVHAELRVHAGKASMLEIAPRTIGGVCSRTLRFAAGASLEEIVLRHALGKPIASFVREQRAAGVMMIPIPRAGVLRAVDGLAEARSVALVNEVSVAAPMGAELVPLPEGHRYLGFIFASGESPEGVEAALREAHARLRFTIEDDPVTERRR